MRAPVPTVFHSAVNPHWYPSTLRSFSVFVLHFFKLGIDHVVTARGALRSRTGRARPGPRAWTGATRTRALLRRVGALGDGGRSLCKCFSLLLDHALVVALERRAQIRDGRLDPSTLGRINLVTQVLQGLIDRMGHAVRLVTGIHQLAEFLVLLRMSLGIADHPLDLILGETAGGLDDDLLF